MINVILNILNGLNKRLEENYCLRAFIHKIEETQGNEYLNEVNNWAAKMKKLLKAQTNAKGEVYYSSSFNDALSAQGTAPQIKQVHTAISNSLACLANSTEYYQLHKNELDQKNKQTLEGEITSALRLIQDIVLSYNQAREVRHDYVVEDPTKEEWPEIEIGNNISRINISEQQPKFWTFEGWLLVYKIFLRNVKFSHMSSISLN